MTSVPPHIDEWIAAVLAGEADGDVQMQLRRWIDDDPGHGNYFRQQEKVWIHSLGSSSAVTPDVGRAWAAVKTQLQTGRSRSREVRFIPWARIAAIAASLALLLASVWWISQHNGTESFEIAASDAVRTDTLSGGIIMTLDKASTALCKVKGSETEVTLSGNGYFDIRDEAHGQLTVKVGELMIRDIGTRFSVMADRPDSVGVEVFDGLVEIRFGEGEVMRVNSGERIWARKSDRRIYRASEGEAESWQGEEIRFTNAPLHRVVRRLNERFGTRLALSDPRLRECRISLTVREADIPLIAGIISETLGLEVVEENDMQVLTGTSCE
jgi:ferric-dicitrate binding protein FerR (iron transport regulator)